MKIKQIIAIGFFVAFIMPFFSFLSLSKYQFQNSFLVAKLEIDNSPPEIELISFKNSNTPYPKYANKTHTITVRVKIIEDYVSKINFDSNHVKIKVNNNLVSANLKKASCISDSEQIYDITFTNICGDGKLSISFLEDAVIDSSLQNNISKTFYSNILIDNTAPVATFSEESIENNYSKGIIKVNECVQPVNGWNISSDNMSLDHKFSNPIEYQLPLKDFAQNSSSVLVSIKNASNISLEYGIYDAGAHNFDMANSGNISGDHLVNSSDIYKAESLLIRSSGNINNSSLKGKTFVYTYYGEGSSGTCKYSELRYNYGYNPLNSFRTINHEYITYFSGNKFTQFGGTGLNYASTSGSNPIPEEIAKQYLYGLSGIALTLDDYSEYSIVYQIYVKGIGWLPAKYNGQETMYKYDKPMSAIRINIVPNSQRQYLIDYWNMGS